MVKKLYGYLLRKKVRHKFLVNVRSFPSAKVSCVVDHVKPTMRDDRSGHVILHTGTNDLCSGKLMSLKDNDNSVIVSGIAPRHDNANNKANAVNNHLVLTCKK